MRPMPRQAVALGPVVAGGGFGVNPRMLACIAHAHLSSPATHDC